jgi:hypothetical protein
MSEIFGSLLELLLNLAGCVLEAMADIWLGDDTSRDTTARRIFWFVVIVFLGGVIWWELR